MVEINNRHSIFDHEILESFRQEHKRQPYRIRQIETALFHQWIKDINDITTLSKDDRKLLSDSFEVIPFTCEKVLEDDETTKFLFRTTDDKVIETVLMYHYHEKDEGTRKLNRVTLCISSQVGCAVGCIFCVTGTLWLLKNLHRTEILAQVIYANNYLKEKLGRKEDGSLRSVRNVVFMGMGEPLMNYPNVKKVCEFLSDEHYFGLSSKRITVSTSGVYQGLEKFITDQLPVSLAFSLHASNQELRAHLVPMAKFYQLDRLMELMDEYVRVSDRQVFYEYVMIRDENDTDEVAHQCGKLLRNRRGHLNLIPYNENPAINLTESDPKQIKRFKDIVESYGVTVTVRQNMGRKEKSACGQLWYEAAQEKLAQEKQST